MTLTLSQSLLFKSCFLEGGESFFKEWLEQFDESQLDYYTRSIIPLLLTRVPAEKIAPSLGKRMMAYKRQTWLLNSSKWQQIKVILNDFANHNIDYCLLKGGAMVLFYYGDLSYRPEHSDIDILIKKQDIPKAINILKKHNFEARKSFLWEADQLKKAVSSGGDVLNAQHAIVYIKNKVNIDLHWHFVSTVGNFDYQALEPYMQSQLSMGNIAHFFCPEMQLVHTATHAAIQDARHPSINSIIDFCYLIDTQKIDLSLLKELCKLFELTDFVTEALENYRGFLKREHYQSYQQSFSSHHSPYATTLFYSKSFFKKRIGQIYFLLKKNNFNPFYALRMLKYYLGAPSYFFLFRHLIKGYLSPILFKRRSS